MPRETGRAHREDQGGLRTLDERHEDGREAVARGRDVDGRGIQRRAQPLAEVGGV